jgi:hypothetical protein
MVASEWLRSARQALPDGFEPSKRTQVFAQWDHVDEMSTVDPNSVFLVAGEKLQLRLGYESIASDDIGEIEIYDRFGRAWINVNVLTGRYEVNMYLTPFSGTEPYLVMSDTNADGAIDRRVHWPEGRVECTETQVIWNPCREH